MNSDENKLYIKIIALNEIYNFVVEVFELKLFRVLKYCCKCTNFKI
jgi:hypothetical protein